jgi:pyrroloquinoline quinone (PQQ) biosynthesis protein C
MTMAPSRPILKENIWHIFGDRETAYVSTTTDSYEVPKDAATTFLRMRSYCTGHNDTLEIAERSGLSPAVVQSVVETLARTGLVAPASSTALQPDQAEVRESLVAACRLWGEELTRTYIGNRFATGELSRTALVGWLLEMFHYIRDFPEVIRHAQERASGPLADLLEEYAGQETGHEEFVLRTLEGLGLSRHEVEQSAPLVSTQSISFIMRRLVEMHPCAMLLIAALVEAQDFDEAMIQTFADALHRHYGIQPDVFAPYFRHQEIDVEMGHAQLLETHLDLITLQDVDLLDGLVNGLHDLKHAFDLQGLEIESYYGDLQGRYLPRQPMAYATISR